MTIIESTSLVQTRANRYNIFIAKDLLPILFNNKMKFSHDSVCLFLELGHSANVGREILILIESIVDLQFQNANLLLPVLISLKISQ